MIWNNVQLLKIYVLKINMKGQSRAYSTPEIYLQTEELTI